MTSGALFVSPAFLEPLVEAGCASPQTGWTPLEGAGLPLYLKSHSWGEFVFDFEFARAYSEHGLNYYPKLLCAAPYTPVPGPRLLDWSGSELRQQARECGASGAHVLFLPENEAAALTGDGWCLRQDLRFVWRNRGYQDFDGFLEDLASKKRKNLRADRRKAASLGFDIRWQHAAEFSAVEWDRLYQLYASTYAMRGQPPYLNQACLMAWARRMPGQFLFCVAREAGDIQAMAFFFRDETTLYGRHWGARADFDALHFELCYYRGIEYCIEHGLSAFDAGVQGGHRLLRGFEPQLTHSAHWFADERFHLSIGRYLARETTLQRQRYEELCRQTAFAQRA